MNIQTRQALVVLVALAIATPASAIFGSKNRKIEQLEESVLELENQRGSARDQLQRIRLVMRTEAAQLRKDYEVVRGEAAQLAEERSKLEEGIRSITQQRETLAGATPILREHHECVIEA